MRGGHDKLIHLSAARWSWVEFPPEGDMRTQVLQVEQKQPAPSLSSWPQTYEYYVVIGAVMLSYVFDDARLIKT